VEPGKSGFAHFFEHMMFRGTKNIPAAEYQRIMKAVGADTNAYTSDDVTNYHATFNKEDLETVLRIEADRFQNLEYAEPEFRTEALAVLGEYNKNNANPLNKLFEVQRNTAFTTHTYKHTTMGFIEDIRQMPEQFAYSRQFFDRYYRPERTSIIIAGDVKPDAAFALVEKYWGNWRPGGEIPAVPVEPAPKGPLYAHVPWESATQPWVAVAFRGPAAYPTATNPAKGDQQALDVLASYAFSPSSALFQRLVVKEQKVDQLASVFPDRVDPSLLNILARAKNKADLAYVRDAIQQELASLRTQPADPARIAAIRSSLKYGFAGALDNTESVAGVVVPYVAATRDVATLNEVYALYDRVGPADIQRVARKYFVDQGMIVTTLAHGDIDAAARLTGGVDRLAAAAPGAAAAAAVPAMAAAAAAAPAVARPVRGRPARTVFRELVQRTNSPLIDVRMAFRAGAADDPPGKEGLAALTARMVTQAGSRALTFQQIQQALFPIAAGFGATVDKETTTFAGKVHRDNAERWYDIIAGQLLEPGLRPEDFTRVKTSLVNNIRVDLRGNNDEELGNEVLYEQLYAGHPYGHLNMGWAKAVEALTIEDVRAFHKANYTQANLTLGVAGGASETFLTKARADLAAGLPVGTAARRRIPAAKKPQGLAVTIVQKPTAAAAISFGYPLEVVRGHPDFVALHLARSFLGEHRSSVAYLYQRMRAIRGMNYGDYAYTEYYPGGMFSTSPPPGVVRSQQAFRVWIRPVPLEQTHFAIRIAKYELDKLVREGMSETDFQATRDFLNKSTGLLTARQGVRLGYSMDQQFHGLGDYTSYIRQGLARLTRAQVNAAIRRHLAGTDMAIVVITPEAEKLRTALIADAPSPITYTSEKPAEILAEDKVIERYPLALDERDVRIVPVGSVFEGRVFS
jgi:zinc protease